MCSYHGDLSRLQKSGGGRIGGTEERQREEIREPKRLETGRKQDLQLSCPVWAPHTAADGFRSWKTTTSPRLGANLKLSK